MLQKFGRDYATKSLVPGKRVYGERIIRKGKEEWRVWDPTSSKLGAALVKGLKNFPIKKGMKILYLGASTGTTVSHISDIVEHDGIIYAVEFSSRSMRDLIPLAKQRKNIAPILDDARLPENYAALIEKADLVYCDVAQPDQSEIIMRNAKVFLKPQGWMMIAIKARSINVAKNPKQIYSEERQKLSKMFNILEQIDLQPLEKDHAFFVGKMK
ncbi:Fibrillarin-like rRNA/tRNA 2'-O-methyltransferase [uncultured archaeon]|nr:Fibrillarin-like rRNA/tRNA 2'-O-methyltransferase [uncultured archaeon]